MLLGSRPWAVPARSMSRWNSTLESTTLIDGICCQSTPSRICIMRGKRKVSQLTRPLQQRSGARTRVVIVGGGFAGLNAAKGLGKLPVDVTVIDRRNHHTFQPLLYQVAL